MFQLYQRFLNLIYQSQRESALINCLQMFFVNLMLLLLVLLCVLYYFLEPFVKEQFAFDIFDLVSVVFGAIIDNAVLMLASFDDKRFISFGIQFGLLNKSQSCLLFLEEDDEQFSVVFVLIHEFVDAAEDPELTQCQIVYHELNLNINEYHNPFTLIAFINLIKRSCAMITKFISKSMSNISTKIRFFNSELLNSPRDVLEYDVVIVGGGVAGLSTAIRLKERQKETDKPISVCVLEKGTQIGDHILSGNCFEPRAFDQLFPNWRQMKQNRPPIQTQVTSDNFYFLYGDDKSVKIPNLLFPKTIHNEGNYVISLGKLTRWMGQRATDMGVDIITGTPGANVLYSDEGYVKGVITQDFGISKKGEPLDTFMRGLDIVGKQTVFAQGCRGSLSQKVIQKFNLRENSDPQLYGIGLKQVWQVQEGNKHFQPGYVQHTVGWPVDSETYAGSFLYHMKPNLVLVGLVVGLNYQNPYLNPYEQFQKLKTHPQIRKFLEGGQCISYGARALNSGGYFSIPKLVFPGGMLVGCSAGFMNVLKIKGSHTAIKSGIQAGNAIFDKVTSSEQTEGLTVNEYQKNMQKSWVWDELYSARNMKNSFKNLYSGLLYGGIYKFLQGKQPFDLRNNVKDSERTQPARNYEKIQYPKHDRKLTFDLLDNLSRSGTNHEHDQPSHLVIKSNYKSSPKKSLQVYDAPQQRFCPARVYEFVADQNGKKRLQINAQNCLHCKTCSIKMIDEYIEWRVPEGNGGPKYNIM